MKLNKTDIKALVIYFTTSTIASIIGAAELKYNIGTAIIFTLGCIASSSMFYLFDRMDGEL